MLGVVTSATRILLFTLRSLAQRMPRTKRNNRYTGEAPAIDESLKEVMMITFLDRFFRMNPKTDDLLFDGTYLRDGMTVLVGDASQRMEITDDMDVYHRDQAELTNAWYTITHVMTNQKYVTFLATYEDGSKRKVTFPLGVPWLVRLNTLYKADGSTEAMPAVDALGLPGTQALPVINQNDIRRILTPPPASKHGV